MSQLLIMPAATGATDAVPATAWFPGLGAGAGSAGSQGPWLVCFAHAGGTPSVFRDWPRRLVDVARVAPVLLPGRGARSRERPWAEIAPLATAVADAMVSSGISANYALFGHSMGALLAYEVGCELRGRGQPEPRHMFVAASRAPHLYSSLAMCDRSDQDLRRLVRGIGGLGADERIGLAYLEHRLPVLRADLHACERYRWAPRAPLDCPMTAFSAADDVVAPSEQVDAWREYTRRSFVRRQLPGGHFFLTDARHQLLLAHLRADLSRHSEKPALTI